MRSKLRLYLAYQITSEDKAAVGSLLTKVKVALEQAGYEVACPYFDVPAMAKKFMAHRDFMQIGFSSLASCDVMLALQLSPTRSEGMLMETGFALAKGIPVVVATRNGCEPTNLPAMGSISIKWDDEAALLYAIKAIDLKALVNEKAARLTTG